ncbi:MAG: hypothetical protein MHMPM18_001730 [Marteilia pararefringens]
MKNSEYKTQLDELRKDLTSSAKHKQIDALKHVNYLLQQGFDLSSLVLTILKLSQDENLTVKKLCYFFLRDDLLHRNNDSDMTILLINTLLRDFESHSSAIIKSMALRIVAHLNFQKYREYLLDRILIAGLRDPDPYVRRNTVMCLVGLLKNNSSHVLECQPLMDVFFEKLSDDNAAVFAAAICLLSWLIVNQQSALYEFYKGFCIEFQMVTKILHILDECSAWQKETLLEFILLYKVHNRDQAIQISERMLQVLSDSHTPVIVSSIKVMLSVLDQLENLKSDEVKDSSHNLETYAENCVLSAVQSLITLLYCGSEHTFAVLNCLELVVAKKRESIVPFWNAFIIKSSEETYNKIKKLEILTLLTEEETLQEAIGEFDEYVLTEHDNTRFISRLIDCTSQLYQRFPNYYLIFIRILQKIFETSSTMHLTLQIKVVNTLCELSDLKLKGISSCLELLEWWPGKKNMKSSYKMLNYGSGTSNISLQLSILKLCGRFPKYIMNYENTAINASRIFPNLQDSQSKNEVLNLIFRLYLIYPTNEIIIDCISKIFVSIDNCGTSESDICLRETATYLWRFLYANQSNAGNLKNEQIYEQFAELMRQDDPKAKMNSSKTRDIFAELTYTDIGLVSGALKQAEKTFVHPFFDKCTAKTLKCEPGVNEAQQVQKDVSECIIDEKEGIIDLENTANCQDSSASVLNADSKLIDF